MDILMPQLGETVAEGKITAWFKSIGDAVAPGESLFEIETDKVSMEVPATAPGVIAEIRVGTGEVAPVGAIVAVMAPGAEAKLPPSTAEPARANDGNRSPARGRGYELSEAPLLARREGAGREQTYGRDERTLPQSSVRTALSDFDSGRRTQDNGSASPRASLQLDPFNEVRTPPKNFGPAKLANGVAVTPLARRLAGEAGIDLGRVALSRRQAGGAGRIVAADVEAAIAARNHDQFPPPSPDRVKALFEPGIFDDVPLDPMRRAIAARLSEATRISRFHLTMDIATDRLDALREEANAAISAGRADTDMLWLTMTDFIVKALALALMRVPAANVVWAEDRILRFTRADVGVAMAVDGGLMPVIRGAEKKSLVAIATEIHDFGARAAARRLNPAELQGGASAVSNLGMHGVREATAMLNPPHATMLTIGAVARRPIEAADGSVRFAGQMTATLTCDQRVIDSALGAELLAAIRHLIEHPVGMMI